MKRSEPWTRVQLCKEATWAMCRARAEGPGKGPRDDTRVGGIAWEPRVLRRMTSQRGREAKDTESSWSTVK